MRQFLILLAALPLLAQDVDKVPSWYKGSKPWKAISVEGRKEMLRLHAGFEATRAKAETPAATKASEASQKQGEALIRSTISKFHLDKFYLAPSRFGGQMVLWLPEKAWEAFSSDQKKAVVAYVSSRYKNWGIGVGRVSGRDVLCDRVVVQ